MPPHLPVELVHKIIDLSGDDKEQQYIYSLVSSTWLARARFHLFYTTCLRNTDHLSFLNLLQLPLCTIPPFVEHLVLYESFEPNTKWISQNVSALSSHLANSVTRLTIVNLWIGQPRSDLDPSGLATLRYTQWPLHTFEKVTRLKLLLCSFLRFLDFLDLLGCFPALCGLHVRSREIGEVGTERDIMSQRRFAPTLKQLDVKLTRQPFMDWLLVQPDLTQIEGLHLYVGKKEFFGPLLRAVQRIGPMLRRLRISFLFEVLCRYESSERAPLDSLANYTFSNNPNLEDLSWGFLVIEHPAAELAWLPQVLQTLPSSIKKLCFDVNVSTWLALESIWPWQALDNLTPTLSRRPGLRVIFNVFSTTEKPEAFNRIYELLPKLSSAGLLVVDG